MGNIMQINPQIARVKKLLAANNANASVALLKKEPILLPFYARMLKRKPLGYTASYHLGEAYFKGAYKFEDMRPLLDALFSNKLMVETLTRKQTDRFGNLVYRFRNGKAREFSEIDEPYLTYLIEEKGNSYLVYRVNYSEMVYPAELLHYIITRAKKGHQDIADFMQHVVKRLNDTNELGLNEEDSGQATKREVIEKLVDGLDRANGIKLQKWAQEMVDRLWE